MSLGEVTAEREREREERMRMDRNTDAEICEWR